MRARSTSRGHPRAAPRRKAWVILTTAARVSSSCEKEFAARREPPPRRLPVAPRDRGGEHRGRCDSRGWPDRRVDRCPCVLRYRAVRDLRGSLEFWSALLRGPPTDRYGRRG